MIKEIRLTRTRPDPNNSNKPPWKESAYGVVRDICYGSHLSKFDRFFEEALKTFPWLSREDVEVRHYAGRYYAGTFGLEFQIPYDIVVAPEGWTPIPELELAR